MKRRQFLAALLAIPVAPAAVREIRTIRDIRTISSAQTLKAVRLVIAYDDREFVRVIHRAEDALRVWDFGPRKEGYGHEKTDA
jgi:hypothetical protein